jgi:hypothetical protein
VIGIDRVGDKQATSGRRAASAAKAGQPSGVRQWPQAAQVTAPGQRDRGGVPWVRPGSGAVTNSPSLDRRRVGDHAVAVGGGRAREPRSAARP